MDERILANKVANNILEFLIDPTVFPVKQRLYFRPEEILRNESYEGAKADAVKAYKGQKKNSDFYPIRNRNQSKEASVMDRKTLIASFDVLAQQFVKNDPIAKDLRTMAFYISKAADEELTHRLAKEEKVVDPEAKPDEGETSDVEAKKSETVKCPKCGSKVLKQTGYCLSCKKKIDKMATDENFDADEFWTKKAADAVKEALVSEITTESTASKVPEEKKEEPVVAAEQPVGVAPVVEAAKPKEAEITPKDVVTTENPKLAAKKDKPEEVIPDVPPVDPMAPPPSDPMGLDVPPMGMEPEKATVNIKGPKEINITLGSDQNEVLNYEGIEISAGMLSTDDIGDLTAEEKSQLDQLFN